MRVKGRIGHGETRPACPALHPTCSPRLRRRRGASSTAPLPPPGRKENKGDIPFEKSPKHRPIDPKAHAQFAAAIRTIPPEKR